MQTIEFFKYQATGNDFILIDDRENKLLLNKEEVVKLCDRHEGVGSDGLILIKSSDVADYYMDFYNPDGTKAEMCGNGIRCLAAFAKDYLGLQKTSVSVATLAGLKSISLNDRTFTVDMGKPLFKAGDIPVTTDSTEVVDASFKFNDDELNLTCVSMGNPHAVIFGDEKLLGRAKSLGPVIENANMFPQRTNVEFVYLNGNIAKAVVWERGAGITQACGTGACAILAAAKRLGKAENELKVDLPGGFLQVKYDKTGNILLTGSAQFIYRGKVEL